MVAALREGGMEMTPEGRVKKILKERIAKLECWNYWPVPTGFGKAGVPDVLLCIDGRLVGIETKAPGRRGEKNRGCSPLQVREGLDIRKSGGLWFVVDCEEEIDRALAHALGRAV
jgi:hypothetical protein